jgi:3D-(3,5/4)-trihydroxycyclohexane-1,2-dione acylhydrolase (decyclizing)
MKTVRLTVAQAIVRWLVAQRTVVDDVEVPLFPGVFAIFGHGNVTGLGMALEEVRDDLPTWRAQNEQGMAHAATAFAKARRRRQIMVATSSIGPGAMNMVTAAATAHANRLPLLLLSGDTFASRVPDPVLQQVEHFNDPSMTVNDAFKAVTRYWDRIMRPEQIVGSLPQALATMLDPGDCGPAFLGLPQDVQAEAYDYPAVFFTPVVHEVSRLRPDRRALATAAQVLRGARKPLVIAGGGVHYSLAENTLRDVAERFGLPVVETMAGKSCLTFDNPNYAGPIGVTGCEAANALAAQADVVLTVGTRLQDFTTGSWTVFRNPDAQVVSINTARFDAVKHRATAVVGDARSTLEELSGLLDGWQAPAVWLDEARAGFDGFRAYLDTLSAPGDGVPTYAQIVGAVNAAAGEEDYVVSSSGGLPGELNNHWRAKGEATFDCEYGFSCMGYEIAGAWGAAMARDRGDVFAMVGDGSYLMLNAELYSSVLSGHKLIVVVCDNGGYAVIDRLQVAQGGAPFNNLIPDCRIQRDVRVDFAQHAASMGCHAETVESVGDLPGALERAGAADRTAVIVAPTLARAWTEGGAFWEVGVPEVSDRAEVRAAREELDAARAGQRVGW